MLLDQIEGQIEATNDQGEKLTWAAVKNLRVQQHELNLKMDGEIQQLQRKYDGLKQPILLKIVDAIAGIPVDKELYKTEQTASINPNKDKPKAIENFWLNVLLKSPLSAAFDNEFDLEILKHCTKVTSQMVDYSKQHIIFTMYFDTKNPNKLFNHGKISLEIYSEEKDGVRNYVKKQEPPKLNFKVRPSEDSFFKVIFNNDETGEENNSEVKATLLWDFHNAYMDCVKVYFQNEDSNDEEEEEIEGIEEQDQEDQEDDEDEDDNEGDEDEPEVNKKRKGNEKGSNIEKPQCKQQ